MLSLHHTVSFSLFFSFIYISKFQMFINSLVEAVQSISLWLLFVTASRHFRYLPCLYMYINKVMPPGLLLSRWHLFISGNLEIFIFIQYLFIFITYCLFIIINYIFFCKYICICICNGIFVTINWWWWWWYM